jgi:hypothetical protein
MLQVSHEKREQHMARAFMRSLNPSLSTNAARCHHQARPSRTLPLPHLE